MTDKTSRLLAALLAVSIIAGGCTTTAALGASAPTLTPYVNTPELSGKATVRATVVPHAVKLTECQFEYGTTEAYGQSSPCLTAQGAPLKILAENSETTIIAHLEGLTSGATYHYRVTAANTTGTSSTPDETFVEPSPESSVACANEARRKEQAYAVELPDCRAFEMVSPADKNGGNVAAESARTRAAADGGAVSYPSPVAFGDVIGTSAAVEYLSLRSAVADPGGSGWSSHAITPQIAASSFSKLLVGLEPQYRGEFSPDLERGVFYGPSSPLTEEPYVANVENLYRREDLRSPGAGSYTLLTGCPLCQATSAPLTAEEGLPVEKSGGSVWNRLTPELAGVTPSLDRVLLESERRLTADTPALVGEPYEGGVHLFESSGGAVRLVGRVPQGGASECDDEAGPACVAAPVSIAGQGAGNVNQLREPALTPRTISDGSDGHSRVFFTVPMNASGTAVEPAGRAGNLYMRIDGHATVQLNVSEVGATAYSPASYWDASADGERVFFTTGQKLTSENGGGLYMYDATEPAGERLTDISALLGGEAFKSFMGLSADGSYAYFATGQTGTAKLYRWHEGSAVQIGVLTGEAAGIIPLEQLATSDRNNIFLPRLARIAPDGSLLFGAYGGGSGLTGYNQGACMQEGVVGCLEFYLYHAGTNSLVCASCNPSGATATADAAIFVRQFVGGAQKMERENSPLVVDGSRVFFGTDEALVSADTNGVSDVYEYDLASGGVRLLSTGSSPDPSYFMDASADGTDVFIDTRQQLVGWDHDSAYDLYDVRAGGGFPEPPPASVPCGEEKTCRPSALAPPGPVSVPSIEFAGPANGVQPPSGASPPRRAVHCRKGTRRVSSHGRVKCVKKRAVHKRRGGSKRKRSSRRKGGSK